MKWTPVNFALDDRLNLKRILAVAFLIGAYALLNRFCGMDLPGITRVEVRPHIVLPLAVGYLLGPWYGFGVGFFGNVCSDLLWGYGWQYVPSWSIGNGLLGALIGLFPGRRFHIERIGQLAGLISALIAVNVVALLYSAGVENILDKTLTMSANLRFFYLPALLSNALSTMLLFPPILLLFGRLKRNYSIKLALANYYLAAGILVTASLVFMLYHGHLLHAINVTASDANEGNELVIVFNRWAALMMCLLLSSFFVSSWMTRAILAPLKRLEEAIYSTLKGDESAPDRLAAFSKREDEIGILSYALRLLGESLWDTQKLFRREVQKNMPFLDARDSGTDILCTALVALFGQDALGKPTSGIAPELAGELNHLDAIAFVVSAGGLRELAATYSDAKIKKSLEELDVPAAIFTLPQEHRQNLALAVDLKLIFKGRLKVMDLNAPLSRDFAFHLLERIHAFRQSSRNYIGYVTEPAIVGKICDAWARAEKIRSEPLEAGLNRAIARRLISGYHIKTRHDQPVFDAHLMMAYSHSDIKHVKQLIGLLMSENLQAKIQLEAKRSAFRYLDEWEKQDGLCLERLGDSGWVAHKDEFDLLLEFTAPEHRRRFGEMIAAYAQREFDDRHQILYQSWYQPLYYSGMPMEGHQRVADIVLRNATHAAHTYVKETDADAVLEWLNREGPPGKASCSAIWVNEVFFAYLAT